MKTRDILGIKAEGYGHAIAKSTMQANKTATHYSYWFTFYFLTHQ